MDERENKLKKGNITYTTQVISQLIDTILEYASSNTSGKLLEDLRILKEKCTDPDPLISTTALNGLLTLVKNGVLDISPTISTIISFLPTVKHCGALVQTITELMILDLKDKNSKSNMTAHRHLVTVYKNRPDSWMDILNAVKFIIGQNDIEIKELYTELLKPLVVHVLTSNQTESNLQLFKLELFTLLIENILIPKVRDLIFEILSWLSMSTMTCLYYQKMSQYMLNIISNINNDQVDYVKKILASILPFLAECTSWMIRNGYNPVYNLCLIRRLLDVTKDSGCIVVYIFALVLVDCPVVYVDQILDICIEIVISGYCNEIFAAMISVSLLNWTIFNSTLYQSCAESARKYLNIVLNKSQLWSRNSTNIFKNEMFKILKNSNQNISLIVHLLNLCESWPSNQLAMSNWLLKNMNTNNKLINDCYMFLAGLFLHSNEKSVKNCCLSYFVKFVKMSSKYSSSVLCLILFKLSVESDPEMMIEFLLALPKMAVEKENIPVIISTISALNLKPSKVVNSLTIRLYLNLWLVENRTYPYLHKALTDSTSGDADYKWELDVTKSNTIRIICKEKPQLHGKELVTLLSEILNYHSTHGDGLPSAIAIDAIAELCEAKVVDIAGTWKALQPKLSKNKNPEVVISLCRLFRLVPELNNSEPEYEKLLSNVLSQLWSYVLLEDVRCVEEALTSLGCFKSEDFTLKCVPEQFRRGLKLPPEFAKTPVEAARNPEDVLPYVPGECWIQLLEKINPLVQTQAGSMLKNRTAAELEALPRGIYHLPQGKPEPTSYSYLQHSSLCRALLSSLQTSVRGLGTEQDVPVVTKCVLNVLSHRYPRHLPPVSWQFLNNLPLKDEECLEDYIKLLSRQGMISSSAKKIVEHFIISFTLRQDNLRTCVLLYNVLPDLCNIVSPNKLRSFIQESLKLGVGEENLEYFQTIIKQLKITLQNGDIHEANRSLLIIEMESLLQCLQASHPGFTCYSECVVELPSKNIERMTSPSCWWQVTPEKLQQSIVIRYSIACRPQCTSPLVWFNECIDSVTTVSELHSTLLRYFVRTLQKNRRHETNSKWLLGLLGRIQQKMFQNGSEKTLEACLFLLDVLFTFVIVSVGCDSMFNDVEQLVTLRDCKLKLYPTSVGFIKNYEDFYDSVLQLVDWTNKVITWKLLPDYYKSTLQESLVALK